MSIYCVCKECRSEGYIHDEMIFGKCPVCGSNHITLFPTERECIGRSRD